jgi:hypothetical protein
MENLIEQPLGESTRQPVQRFGVGDRFLAVSGYALVMVWKQQ